MTAFKAYPPHGFHPITDEDLTVIRRIAEEHRTLGLPVPLPAEAALALLARLEEAEMVADAGRQLAQIPMIKEALDRSLAKGRATGRQRL